ncbi:MAG: YezD family protein [Spartobacteria bacterium]
MSATSPTTKSTQALPEQEILQAVREVRFGTVEIVVHDRRVMEIRQTKKVRIPSAGATSNLTDLKSGG